MYGFVRCSSECLPEKIFDMDTGPTDFASAKDADTSKSEDLFPASSKLGQFPSEFSNLHRPNLHSEDPLSLVTTLFPSTKGDQWSMTSDLDGSETIPGGSMRFESSDHLSLAMDDEASDELVKHLRTKISALESYTDTLLTELTTRDANLERLRRDNALLRQQLDEAKALAPPAQQELPSAADLCATSEGSAPSELEELRRRCKELEQVVFEVSQELRHTDGRNGASKDDSNSESHV